MPPKISRAPDYVTNLRLAKSLLVVSSLQKRKDEAARKLIEDYKEHLGYEPLSHLLIEEHAWVYVQTRRISEKFVFAHPALMMAHPATSLYYRGLCGLSIKAVKDYVGAIESLEKSVAPRPLSRDKAVKMCGLYNLFISSIIVNSTNWSLENGNRTILATLGITLDGTMRNRVGEIGEDRIRRMVVEWLLDRGLISKPELIRGALPDELPRHYELKNSFYMKFSSEPDIAFDKAGELRATVEIKGGIDPAGALERYGAAKKSFQEAVNKSPHCKNFYLGGVITPELKKRIDADRLVERTFNIIELIGSETDAQRLPQRVVPSHFASRVNLAKEPASFRLPFGMSRIRGWTRPCHAGGGCSRGSGRRPALPGLRR
jgi:hypothetical protein